MIQRALVSVSDKTGLVPFVKGLVALGIDIISTGGTLKLLQEAGIPARPVSELTEYPEMMDGRVKTLHPRVHGGILAIRDNEKHQDAMKIHGIVPIDLVVVNLYPFRETIANPKVTLPEAIEQIDIGGPSMVRSAAKNNAYVGIVVDPSDYDAVLATLQMDGTLSDGQRLSLARKAFSHTASYDSAIAAYMWEQEQAQKAKQGDEVCTFAPTYVAAYDKVCDLRYGENPHQQAALYKDLSVTGGVAQGKQLHGKELSYNNLVDMNAAWNLVQEFEEPACAIIKHTNPCGTAVGATLVEAYERALAADPVSAFGGIVACNQVVDGDTAAKMKELFLEVIMAPGFTEEAMTTLTTKKNLRLIALEPTSKQERVVKKISGGLLVQDADVATNELDQCQVVTNRKPTAEEMAALAFTWKVVKHVKSNAIVVGTDTATLGVGAGQMNRVGAAAIALEEAGEKAKGAVLASDAFFPFGDTVALAAKHGITAIIQPGGSVRDQESIDAANEHGIAMVFTGVRHFNH